MAGRKFFKSLLSFDEYAALMLNHCDTFSIRKSCKNKNKKKASKWTGLSNMSSRLSLLPVQLGDETSFLCVSKSESISLTQDTQTSQKPPTGC